MGGFNLSDHEEALKYEALDKPLEALRFYEKAISSQSATLDDYINAAVLLFDLQDTGAKYHYRVPDDLFNSAWDTSLKYLEMARNLYGKLPELIFWEKEFRFYRLGEESFEKECEELVKQGTLIPYFHILAVTDKKEYVPQGLELYQKVKREKTAKERYIKSILESSFQKLKVSFE